MIKRVITFLLCAVMCLSLTAVSFAEEGNTPQAGDYITFGHYEQDNDLKNGPEPIEWVVLEVKGDKIFLLSRYILDALPFNTDLNGNAWNTSSLRAWLNNDFREIAFSEKEKQTICQTVVDNNPRMGDPAVGVEETQDYLFLIALEHVGEKTIHLCTSTEYAKPKIKMLDDNGENKGLWSNVNYMEEQFSPWWLRMPAPSWHCIYYVSFRARNDNRWYGGGGFDPRLYADRQSCCGVRPAMWISLSGWRELNPVQEVTDETSELQAIECDASVGANTVLGETAWKLWLPEGFEADELTEADLAENYIGYYLRDDDIIAVQYSDNSDTLAAWQKQLQARGFTIEGLYRINGSEAVLYRDEEADTMTASILGENGKMMEVSFYPYSEFSDEADTVISSIQQEASRRRLSGASGNSRTASGTEQRAEAVSASMSPEEAYEAMVTAYKEKKYSDSYAYYKKTESYNDADKYGNLLKARLCYDLELNEKEIEELEKDIVNHISFADSAEVLVCNSKIAHYYLLGFWKTSNGMHSYEVTDNRGTTTTVPVIPRTGDYYAILNGTYWRYFDGKWDERTAVFDFKPISKTQMEIYSYQVKQSYTFNKVR